MLKQKKQFVIAAAALFSAFLFSGCNSSSVSLPLSGTVEAEQYDISSDVQGRITALQKTQADRVTKGDVIALVDSSLQELAVKQQQILVDLRQKNLDALKEAPQIQDNALDIAEAELEQAKLQWEQAKLLLQKYTLTAQHTGTLLQTTAAEGDMVNPGSVIGTIADLEQLWVYLYVPQKHLDAVSLQQSLTLYSFPDNGMEVKGVIEYIADKAEYTPKNTETNEAKENTYFKIKVRLVNPPENLKPGMTLSVDLPVKGKE